LVGGELVENHLDEKDEDKKERQRDRLMSVEEVVGDDEKRVNVERRDSPASVSPTSTLAGVPLETDEAGREHSIKKAE
jgi:hypothetical protein